MAVAFTEEGAIGVITLDRPPANSYDGAFMDELAGAIEAAAASDAARVILLRSASDRFFSAGADVKAFQASTTAENMAMIERAHSALATIAAIPKIFIAEIGGHALGGGLEMALACDLRFGAEGDYKLGVPEVTLGLLPGNGGTQRLPRLIGWSRALDLMITGRTLTPPEAHQIGILDRLVPSADLAEEVRSYAETLASGASRAIGTIKVIVHRGLQGPLDEGLQLERQSIKDLFESADAREGISAFAEKRKPVYTGL